jgi:hypothetical protein
MLENSWCAPGIEVQDDTNPRLTRVSPIHPAKAALDHSLWARSVSVFWLDDRLTTTNSTEFQLQRIPERFLILIK